VHSLTPDSKCGTLLAMSDRPRPQGGEGTSVAIHAEAAPLREGGLSPLGGLIVGERFALCSSVAGCVCSGTVARRGYQTVGVLIDGRERERQVVSGHAGGARTIVTIGGLLYWPSYTLILRLGELRDVRWWMKHPTENPPLGEGETAMAANKAAALPIGNPAQAAAQAAAAKAPKPPREPKALNPCKCGCGEMVSNRFRQGHDGRYYSLLRKVASGELEFAKLPPQMQQEARNVPGVKKILEQSGHKAVVATA
jgi:hypothetical protein